LPIEHSPFVWIAFVVGVLLLLTLDIGVFHRRAHRIGFREAVVWSTGWVSLAVTFGIGVYFWLGSRPALEYATGYLVELSLSIDNLFVFAVILSAFGVPLPFQHRVLFWGIVGALVMRGGFILAGSALLHAFHWTIYLFAGLLIFAAIRVVKETEPGDPRDNWVLKTLGRFVPIVPEYHGQHFTIVRDGKRVGTALLAVLILIEISDIMFAVDSVPAILAITQDPFLVYSSNVFAILGLRSMYFVLGGVLDKFQYLRFGLALILGFIGVKLLVNEVYEIEVWWSLIFIVTVVSSSILVSLIVSRRAAKRPPYRYVTPPAAPKPGPSERH
jgi:tellurite resistance protein TerC